MKKHQTDEAIFDSTLKEVAKKSGLLVHHMRGASEARKRFEAILN